MSSINRAPRQATVQNHHGLVVKQVSPENQLVRLTMAHMLWEKQFYIDGQEAAKQLSDAAAKCSPDFVALTAVRARTEFKLRHVPLVLARTLAKTGDLKAADLAEIIQRPDEMSEFLSLYWNTSRQVPNPHYGVGGNAGRVTDVTSAMLTKTVSGAKKDPISNQVKKGLALAFSKFNEFQLAKWDKNSSAISLRDVMFLAHPKPANAEQEALFKRVANKELVTPDTWETELSAGADKRVTFTRLMREKKLGALAFLRNLRNMHDSGVSDALIRSYAIDVNVDRVLPFRFIAAARIVPQFEDMLENMMFRALAEMPKLPGKTVLLVDISGSMFGTKVTEKSDLDRFDAACALAILARELCESVEIFSFSTSTVRVAPRRGFALAEAIKNSQHVGGTDLHQAIQHVNASVDSFDRCICFTDEQSSTAPGKIKSDKNYILNVGSYKNGINNFEWLTVTGFSEAVFNYIQAYESM
jgi:hypothetical protein